jgi:ABC-2 type transport system permease protein
MTTSPTPPATPSAEAAASNIYDLGYRRYEGERLGRRDAVLALYRESLRGAFGLGRSAASKVAPAILIGIALVPALVQLIIAAVIPIEAELIRAEDYYGLITLVLALFCGVVAPDIVGRDQRNRSLTLYFSRAISRTDYALGKLAAMTTAMLAITLAPQVLLFAGNALGTQDFGGFVADEWTQVFPIVFTAAIGSTLIASIGTVVAAQTPQRAFATVGIIVAFVLPLFIASILVQEIGTEVLRPAVFISPLDLLDGTTVWLFGGTLEDSVAAEAGFHPATYLAGCLAITAIAVGLLLRRYAKVQA